MVLTTTTGFAFALLFVCACVLNMRRQVSFSIEIWLKEHNVYMYVYCILRGRIKGINSSITTIMCQGDSYRTVVG